MLRKRSITVSGHRTSISLEDEFWSELSLIARQKGTSLSSIIAKIDEERDTNLSSAIRLFVLKNLRAVVPNETA